MSEITKVNPCNKCWKEPEVLGYAARDIVQYHCCGDTGWMTYAAWQSANPLTEKPVETKIGKAVASGEEEFKPLPHICGDPNSPCDCSCMYYVENELRCWCGAEWEVTKNEKDYIHPTTGCLLDRVYLRGDQIRFLFGQNPRVKELEDEAKKAHEKCRVLQAERDTLQSKIDAIPPERFTSPVAYENLARRYALACRIVRAFTDIVLEHDD